MAIITSWNYGEDGLFQKIIGPSDRIWMSASRSTKSSLEVGQWAAGTLITDDAGTNIIGVATNCRYVDNGRVNIRESGPIQLTANTVSKSDCSIRIEWSDDSTATRLTNCKFYAFNGVDPNVPPSNINIVAFERTDLQVMMDQVNNDTFGKAWDMNYGINGLSNALQCMAQPLAAAHYFYLGFSASVITYGTHTSAELRVSFDVS